MPRNVSVVDPVSKFTFTDLSNLFRSLDFDGTTDLLMIVNTTDGFMLEVHYNKHVNVGEALCQSFPSFPYDFRMGAGSYIQRITLPGKLLNSSSMSIGDANSDGYPDLLTLLMDSSNDTRAYLLINELCAVDDVNCSSYNEEFAKNYTGKLRTLKYDAAIGDPITTIATAVVSASFTDIAFDGRLDIIVNARATNGSNSLLGIINNLKEDTFFIKALPLTSFSSEDDGRLVNSFGITFQWKITSLEGQYLNSVASQLSQQTGRALQLPFVCTGLGRTNNYL